MVKTEKPQILEPKKCISVHAVERFEQRHGILFTNAQAKSIIKDIISKKAQFVAVTNENQWWIAEYKEKKYKVVYSPKNQIIVTVYAGIKKKKKKPSRKKKYRNKGKMQSEFLWNKNSQRKNK